MKRAAAAVLLIGLMLLSVQATFAASNTTADVTQGDWRAVYSPQRGISLWYKRVPVTTQSTLYFVKPGWAGILYDQRAETPIISVDEKGGSKIITIQTHNANLTVGYTITLSTDDSVTTELHYSLNQNIPGELEYAAGYLNAPLLAGMPFSAQTANGSREGVIPDTTPGTDQLKNRFVPTFRDLTVQTRIGALNIQVSGDWPDFVCFDARRDPQGWAQEAPIFWMGLGVLPHPLDYAGGKTFHVVTRYQFAPSAITAPVAPPIAANATQPRLIDLAEAYAPQNGSPVVIPQPKSMIFTGKEMGVNAQTRLVIADDATAQDKEAAVVVQQTLSERFGLQGLKIVRAAAVATPYNVIVFGEPSRNPLTAKLLRAVGAVPASKAEGYTLRVGPHWAVVAGHDRAGTYYGAQTLRQLFVAGSKGLSICGAAVDDYPALSWRGAHLFVGKNALPFHEKLIENIFSRLKMNNLVLECERTKWNAIGATAPPSAMSKNDLRQEVGFAKRHFLSVTPLIASVGHMDWLFSDPSRLSLAEDPQTPWAMKATNPESNKFLFHLYDEVIDLFHPQYLHIGGDEVTIEGRYPYLSAATYPTVADEYIEQVTSLHDYLKNKGVKTMMWGDMLLARGEAKNATNAPTLAQAKQMRSALPKDIAICDWHYQPNGAFKSPSVFQKSGFRTVIGSTWYNPEDIARFAHALAAAHQTGLLQTTWAGRDSNEQNLIDDPKQFTAFVLAGDYAWTGAAVDPDKLPYSPSRLFEQWYAPSIADSRPRSGFAVDLSAFANRALADNDSRAAWLGYGGAHDLRQVPTGLVRLNGTQYSLAPKAIMLAGAFNPPGTAYPHSIDIPLNHAAAKLSLVMATTYSALPKTVVGKITLTYADGAADTIPLIYGQNIAAWNDSGDAANADEVWHAQTPGGDFAALRALVWKNPHPRKAIRSVTITVTDPVAAPTLFAITGLNP